MLHLSAYSKEDLEILCITFFEEALSDLNLIFKNSDLHKETYEKIFWLQASYKLFSIHLTIHSSNVMFPSHIINQTVQIKSSA